MSATVPALELTGIEKHYGFVRRSTTSTSTSTPARSSPSSATTVPASPRCSR